MTVLRGGGGVAELDRGDEKRQRFCTRATVPMNQLSDMYASAERCASWPAAAVILPRALTHWWVRLVSGRLDAAVNELALIPEKC